jgi:hypothetical protein
MILRASGERKIDTRPRRGAVVAHLAVHALCGRTQSSPRTTSPSAGRRVSVRHVRVERLDTVFTALCLRRMGARHALSLAATCPEGGQPRYQASLYL